MYHLSLVVSLKHPLWIQAESRQRVSYNIDFHHFIACLHTNSSLSSEYSVFAAFSHSACQENGNTNEVTRDAGCLSSPPPPYLYASFLRIL